MQMSKTYLREAGSHVFPCLRHPLHSCWIPGCFRFAQFAGAATAQLLFAPLVARFRHNGLIRFTIYCWILQVSHVDFSYRHT